MSQAARSEAQYVRTAVEEDEYGPTSCRGVAFGGEDADGAVAKGVILDISYLERLRSAHHRRGVAHGRTPWNLVYGNGVLEELLVEGGILWEELVRDLVRNGLVDNGLGHVVAECAGAGRGAGSIGGYIRIRSLHRG